MTLLITIIVLALAFDFINGFHDAANSIATIVSTKVLSPFVAVLWAAFFNFVAYLIFDLNIADTISKTVDSDMINLWVVFSGLIAAILWNLLTWYFGIPSSSSHTLIGGFAGAAIAHGGLSVVNFQIIAKIAAFILLAPMIGMLISYSITLIILWTMKRTNPHKAEKWFRKGQLVSSALFSIGHGGNDAQKVMGIIGAAVLVYLNTSGLNMEDVPEWLRVSMTVVEGKKHLSVPTWVPLACYTAIALGTMSGGWRIVKTMGTKITKITPLEGVAAETGGAITLYLTEFLKIPVSTTHTITGSIIGVGVTKGTGSVRWGVTVNLMWAWILTIPISAAVAAIIYYAVSFLHS
ncbi:MAG TPA: anion permease [Bacteroidales bacterium]|nr:MAG: inorganic phosphate transporter [Bacteroidetes bacterium GWF2_33_38]OFY75023.1 MAG: inorganic phosphate transporter [Bacteroidetes bacterium RIFOXYA12_FULL_33_9]OFY88069.1 MAG: inorganic phosphate transporter [Bacteroidetes bacterium RIFOXYA2_FULL_33_7]HBF87192.1 anion permease [Bacteroidales bacterium]